MLYTEDPFVQAKVVKKKPTRITKKAVALRMYSLVRIEVLQKGLLTDI